jgi:hypothetical protein
LVQSLQHWRDAEKSWSKASLPPGLRSIDAHRATIERAKSVLMLHYGMGSHQAFALLVRWSRRTHTAVHTVAETLVRVICEGDVETARSHRPLMRWLEDRSADQNHDRTARQTPHPPPG